MLQFNAVLCPIDFSDTSLRALAYAATLARWYDAHLEVLHVVPAFEENGPPGQSGSEAQETSRDRSIAELERSVRSAGAQDLRTKALVEEGRAHDVVAHRARELPADLLVMGTHGRSGFNRLLMGSVTEKVLRQVTCPVLTVPPAAPRLRDAPGTFGRILCAIDYSSSSLRALEYALDLGRQAGSCVTVLHALEYTDPDEVLESSVFDPCHQLAVESRRRRQGLLDHARRRLHTLVAQEPATWCEIKEVVVVERAYKAILHHADETKVDLIVMGAQGTGGLELMLYGSNTQHVLRAATCPVLTLRA